MASIAFSEVSKVFPDGTAAVAGLEEATAGTIRIANRVVNDIAPKDRDIAMVFQSYALYPHMSVQDNLGFALKMHTGLALR